MAWTKVSKPAMRCVVVRRGAGDGMRDRGKGRGDLGFHPASVLILMGVLILLKAMALAAAGGKSLLRVDVDGVLRLMGSDC